MREVTGTVLSTNSAGHAAVPNGTINGRDVSWRGGAAQKQQRALQAACSLVFSAIYLLLKQGLQPGSLPAQALPPIGISLYVGLLNSCRSTEPTADHNADVVLLSGFAFYGA